MFWYIIFSIVSLSNLIVMILLFHHIIVKKNILLITADTTAKTNKIVDRELRNEIEQRKDLMIKMEKLLKKFNINIRS